MRYVRIIVAPLGEAPLWVREKWIGLELPVLQADPITADCGGVLTSSPEHWFRRVMGRYADTFMPATRVTGYAAPIDVCIDILAERHPDAADWWRKNTPHLLGREDWWLFDSPACQLLPLAKE